MVSKVVFIGIIAAAVLGMTSIGGLQGVQSAQAQECGSGSGISVSVCHNNICANVGVNAQVLAQGAQALRQAIGCQQ